MSKFGAIPFVFALAGGVNCAVDDETELDPASETEGAGSEDPECEELEPISADVKAQILETIANWQGFSSFNPQEPIDENISPPSPEWFFVGWKFTNASGTADSFEGEKYVVCYNFREVDYYGNPLNDDLSIECTGVDIAFEDGEFETVGPYTVVRGDSIGGVNSIATWTFERNDPSRISDHVAVNPDDDGGCSVESADGTTSEACGADCDRFGSTANRALSSAFGFQ